LSPVAASRLARIAEILQVQINAFFEEQAFNRWT
jgi:hypothetical protein